MYKFWVGHRQERMMYLGHGNDMVMQNPLKWLKHTWT